jgi:hypothetical protein
LALSKDPRSILTHLDQHYLLKPNSIGVPKTYPGTTISKFQLPDDPSREQWAITVIAKKNKTCLCGTT